jgi:hypothetical protein
MPIPLFVLPVLTVAAALLGDVVARKVDDGAPPAPRPPPRPRPPDEERGELIGRLLEEILPALRQDFGQLRAAVERGSFGTARDEADSVLVDYGVLVETLHDLELTRLDLFPIVAKASAKEDGLRESIGAVHTHLASSNLRFAQYEVEQLRRWLPALLASIEADLGKVVGKVVGLEAVPVDPVDVRIRFDVGLGEMVSALASILALPESYLDTIREQGTAFDSSDLTLIEAHDALERWARIDRHLSSFGTHSMPWPMQLVLLRRGADEMSAALEANARLPVPVAPADFWRGFPADFGDFRSLHGEIRAWHDRFFDAAGKPRPTPLRRAIPDAWRWEVAPYDGTSLEEYDGFDHDGVFVMNPFYVVDGTGNRVPDPYDEGAYGWNPAFLDFMKRHPNARVEIGHDSDLVYRDVTSTTYKPVAERSWSTGLVKALSEEGIPAVVTDVGVQVAVRDDRAREFARMMFWPPKGVVPVGIELDYVDDEVPGPWRIVSSHVREISTEEDLGLVAEWTGELIAALLECHYRDVSPDDRISPLHDIASIRLVGDPETEPD